MRNHAISDFLSRASLPVLASGALLWAAVAAAQPAPLALTVTVTNVRDAKGHVHAEACPEAQFLKDDCPYFGSAPAQIGTTKVTITGLPPGRYAVQAFHDENDNRKVDRALFGIPKEGVGFSNDAPIRFGPPKFTEAVFTVGTVAQTITLRMRYFLGPSGPQAGR